MLTLNALRSWAPYTEAIMSTHNAWLGDLELQAGGEFFGVRVNTYAQVQSGGDYINLACNTTAPRVWQVCRGAASRQPSTPSAFPNGLQRHPF